MKKLFLAIVMFLIVVTGCNTTTSTPTRRVEDFMMKYQGLDSEVLNQLDRVVANDSTMNDEQKKDYTTLMKKQYQNLSYKIKDEKINGDDATVDVEIEVFDYHNALEKVKDYIKEHEDEFEKDEKDSSQKKKEEYRIKQLKAVTDKANYTITFHLEKEDKVWKLQKLSDEDLQKIHGLYENR